MILLKYLPLLTLITKVKVIIMIMKIWQNQFNRLDELRNDGLIKLKKKKNVNFKLLSILFKFIKCVHLNSK